MTQIRLGPPYGGAFYHPAGPGAWSVARVYGNTGQIVVQLGGQPPKPYTDELTSFAGFDFPFRVDQTGDYVIAASVDVGPVSMLPRGFTALTQLAIGLEFGDGAPPTTFTPPPQGVVGAYYGTFTLAFRTHLTANTSPFLTLGAGALINYTGSPNPAPYAEMICTYKNATATLLLATKADASANMLASLRKSPNRVTRQMTEEDWAREEVIVFKR
jgi:hypothetical protein